MESDLLVESQLQQHGGRLREFAIRRVHSDIDTVAANLGVNQQRRRRNLVVKEEQGQQKRGVRKKSVLGVEKPPNIEPSTDSEMAQEIHKTTST
jgi:hypothetical protein